LGLFRRRKRRVSVDARLADLTDFLHAAGHDQALAAWLRRLPDMPDGDRAVEVHRVARNMRRAVEPAEVVSALTLLSNKQLARSAAEAIE